MSDDLAPLELRAATRRFGPSVALDGVDLAVGRGEVLALLGLNGAGKTTAMRLLLGMLRPDGGEALVWGRPARRAPASTWRKVGHLIETPLAYGDLTTRCNLTVAGRLHGLRGPELGRAVDEAIERFGLTPGIDKRARQLSLGNRQRLGLAAALLHRPEVLVLDEPTNGLDPVGIVEVRDLLRSRAAGGAAVLVSSHHLDEVARTADRVVVMHDGRVVATLQPGEGRMEQRFFDLVLEAQRAGGDEAMAADGGGEVA